MALNGIMGQIVRRMLSDSVVSPTMRAGGTA